MTADERHRQLRYITPVMASLSPILIVIVGWFIVRTLDSIDYKIEKQTTQFTDYRDRTESRLGVIETIIRLSKIDERYNRAN